MGQDIFRGAANMFRVGLVGGVRTFAGHQGHSQWVKKPRPGII